MNWEQACTEPHLKNLPFKIELNQWGQIVMSPVKLRHSIFQGKILRLLYKLLDKGEAIPECAIRTKNGTKVADVAWISAQHLEAVKYESECSVAPEICAEVMSASNTDEEMAEKRALYFEAGASEVWICDEQGNMAFYNRERELETSLLVSDFPKEIDCP